MKVCLFGGSFDPVHAGHLTLAEAAHAAQKLDSVVFLPAACSPFKEEGAALFSAEARLQMLRLATARLPWAIVSDRDLKLPPPSWSWRLVESWRQEHPEDELFWLLGTDQWEELHRWGRYEYLVEHLTFLVYHRGHAPAPRAGVRAHFLIGHHPASSTLIRGRLQKGEPLPTGWLPQAVEEFARQELRRMALSSIDKHPSS